MEGITAASGCRLRLRRRKNQIAPAIRRRRTIATAMKVPATLPESEKKPPLFSFAVVIIVVAVAGGAVGVIVNVFTWPVTVAMDVKGVAEKELLDVVLLDGVVVGVEEVVRVVGVEVVVGVRLSDTGMIGAVELVDVVEGVYKALVSKILYICGKRLMCGRAG